MIMREFKHKNDYSLIVFNSQRTNDVSIKLMYVHNIYKAVQWLNRSRKYYNWHHINVYVRRTGRFIHQISDKDNFITPYPKK